MRKVLVPTGIALLVSEPSLAHTTIEGIGNFYNGLIHPFVVPAHVLVLVALGLLVGQRGADHLRSNLPAFALALGVALFLSGQVAVDQQYRLLLIVSALSGLLVAGSFRLSKSVSLAFSLGAAVLIGLDSKPDDKDNVERLVTLAGIWIASCFLLLWFFALADAFRRHWQRIAVRVAGSWITAISIMVLALDLRT
jgi:urease accessory protein